MKYVFFLALTLLSCNGFSQNNDAFDKEFEKLPPAQQKEVFEILLMKAGMDHELAQNTPEITITGMEGFKFKTQIPMVAENNADQTWKKYKDPKFVKTPLILELLVDQQGSALEYLPYEENYPFRFYTIGSEFTIKSFIHVGSNWMFILTDKTGKDILLDNEHILNIMLEGDKGNFQGTNAIIIDWLMNGKRRQTVKAENFFSLSGLSRFIEALKNGDKRLFSVVEDRRIPIPEPATKGGWINYFLKKVNGKQAIITNEKEVDSRVIFDIEADTEDLMLLVYADFIKPHSPDFKYNDAYDRHRLFQNQDEANLIGDVLHKKRKRSKEEMEELRRIEEEMKKRKQ